MTEKTIILPPNPAGNGGDASYRLTVMVPKRRYFSYLRERWWLVLIFVAVAASAMLVYQTLQPDVFQSSAQLYARGEMQVGIDSYYEDSQNYYGTQIEMLKSGRLRNAALAKINYMPQPGERGSYNVDVFQPGRSSILQVQVTGPDPGTTQRFLQALIDEYLAYKKETRLLTSEDILNSLTDQLNNKDKELQDEQAKWAEFRKTNNVAVLEAAGKDAGVYLDQLDLQLRQLKMERDLYNQSLAVEAAQEATSDFPIAVAPSLAHMTLPTNAVAGPATNDLSSVTNEEPAITLARSSDSELRAARLTLALTRAERDRMKEEHGEASVKSLDETVIGQEKKVALLEMQVKAEQRATVGDYDRRIAAIAGSIPSLESNVLNINERLSQGQLLVNNVDRVQAFYDHLLTMLQNVDLGTKIQQERLSVLEPASPPALLEKNLVLRTILAAVFGAFLSLGLVFVWYLLDDRFVSVRDIKDQYGEMVLGLVPQIKISRTEPAQALLRPNYPRQPYVESYRHLRSALLLSTMGKARPQILLFTGAAPAEGKTTIAINLARVLALSGLRIVLVDADPYGSMDKLLSVPAGAGLLDFLRGEAGIKTVIHPTSTLGLNFVPIGGGSDHAEGLLLQPRLDALINELKANCDFVIVDGAPILATDDAALWVPFADAVILVVRPFFSRSYQVRRTLEMLYQRQAKNVAIIFNRARADDMAGHYAENGYRARKQKAPANV